MYKIIGFKSPEAVVIYHQPTGEERTVHVNHLRLLFGNAAWDKIYTTPTRVAPKRLANQKLRALRREEARMLKRVKKSQPFRTQKLVVPTPTIQRNAPSDEEPSHRAKRPRTTGPVEDNTTPKPRTLKRKRSPSGEDPPRIGPAAGTRSQTPAPLTPAATPLPIDTESSSESQMSCDQDKPEPTAPVPMAVDRSPNPKRPLSDTSSVSNDQPPAKTLHSELDSTAKRPLSDTGSESNGQPPAKMLHHDDETASEESLDAPLLMAESSEEEAGQQQGDD